MRLAAAALVLMFSASSGVALLAQGPPPPPPPPPPGRDFGPQTQKTGTARLSGRVTSLDSGRPIRRAVVRISGPELREGKSVSSDADGRWELRELPAGRFTLSVTKGGYVSLSYGQRRPFEAGKTLDVANAQVIEKLDIALPRAGAITGKVVDEFGEPVSGVNVSPMRYRFTGGQRRMTNSGMSDTTDDLGQFRLHGLAPGDYYVTARSSSFTFLGTSDDRTGYGQTYYPGTLNAGEATRLNVTVGQEVQNILISLAPSRIANLSGTATTSEGKPVSTGMIMLRNTSTTGPLNVTPALVRDGTWTMNGVVPGEYQLMLQYVPNLEQIAMTGSTTGITSPEFATETLVVTGEDMTGIALVTRAGGTVRGTARFEGAPAPAVTSGMAMTAAESIDTMTPLGGIGIFKPDWSFELKGAVGRRVLRPGGLPSGWFLKSITYEGNDITDAGIDIAAGQEISGVEVLFTRSAAEVSGTVQTAKGTPVEDYVVVLFPPEPDRWGWQSRFVRVGRPDQTGRFILNGIVPASYLAVALEYLEPGEESNPEFLEKLKSLGTAVRVDEGEKKTLTLKLSAQ